MQQDYRCIEDVGYFCRKMYRCILMYWIFLELVFSVFLALMYSFRLFLFNLCNVLSFSKILLKRKQEEVITVDILIPAMIVLKCYYVWQQD